MHRVALATVTGDADLSTDNGRLYARIKGAVARVEVERKGARQKRAALQPAEAGKAWTPVRWFGYTMPRSDGTGVKIVAAEAKVLRKLYSDVLAGRSLMGLARDLNANGVQTVRGNQWSATTLREVLLSPRSAGLRHYRKSVSQLRGMWRANGRRASRESGTQGTTTPREPAAAMKPSGANCRHDDHRLDEQRGQSATLRQNPVSDVPHTLRSGPPTHRQSRCGYGGFVPVPTRMPRLA